ncbi:MAG: purine-cytosine permease family protein [Candidatus Dormibacteraceae bacterium]
MNVASSSATRVPIERRGIDYVPAEERHGRPASLFTLWFASNVQVTALATGALAVVLGLNFGWAVGAILIGNLAGGLFMAYHSAQGPRLGIPQMIQSRAQFGMFGALLPLAVVVCIYGGFFITSAILGGQAIASLLHIPLLGGLVIADAISLLLAWVGYDLIHRWARFSTVVSGIIFVVLTIKLITIAHLSYKAPAVTGGAVLLVISIIASWQLTWAPYVSDYSRYLPEKTPAGKTFWYTYLGSALGGSWLMILGALAATVAANAISADAPGYLSALFGSGWTWLFLLVFIVGLQAANVENLYGGFMVVTTAISPSGKIAPGWLMRLIWTSFFAVAGTVIGYYASVHFLTNLINFLVFLLYLIVPWTAINLTDYYLIRRGNYSIPDIFKVTGRYGVVNWLAVGVFVLTVLIELPFMNSAIYVGPISHRLGDADIAWIVGLIVAGGLYYIAARAGLHTRAAAGAGPGETAEATT